MDQKERNVK